MEVIKHFLCFKPVAFHFLVPSLAPPLNRDPDFHHNRHSHMQVCIFLPVLLLNFFSCSILGPTYFLNFFCLLKTDWLEIRQFHAANSLKILIFVKTATPDLHLRHVPPRAESSGCSTKLFSTFSAHSSPQIHLNSWIIEKGLLPFIFKQLPLCQSSFSGKTDHFGAAATGAVQHERVLRQ